MGKMAVSYFHVEPDDRKIYSFIDTRHNRIYNINAKNVKKARTKLKQKLIGEVWDKTTTEDELWYYVQLADKVENY